MKKTILGLIAVSMLSLSPLARAQFPYVSQADFNGFAHEIGVLTSYRHVAPAEPLGILGFDISVEATSSTITTLAGMQTIMLPKVKLQKGLMMGFDIAGYYAQTSFAGQPIGGYGIAVNYALLEGTIVTPALAVRGAYTTFSMANVINSTTMSADISMSKGLGPWTPYIGIGYVTMSGSDVSGLGLVASKMNHTRTFYGINFALTILSLAFEADDTAGTKSYTFKGGIRF